MLRAAHPGLDCHTLLFDTQGDRSLDTPLPNIGGKGVFTAELERALLAGDIDIAVHSLKDLPTEATPGLTLGAITARADVRDVLIAPAAASLDALPRGAIVGTSSHRRAAQLLALRPDLAIKPIRGNVETRIQKVQDGQYDAAVLAMAGVARLGLESNISAIFTLDEILPAPGQAALAVQCRAADATTLALLREVDDLAARIATEAERSFLAGLGGGCSAPVAAYASIRGNAGGNESGLKQTEIVIEMSSLVASLDGSNIVRVQGSGDDAEALGRSLARQAREQGADELLAAARIATG